MSLDHDINCKPSIKQIILTQELKLKENEVLKFHQLEKYELKDLLDHIKRQQNLIDAMAYMIDQANLAFTCNDCVLFDECTITAASEGCQLKMIMEGVK